MLIRKGRFSPFCCSPSSVGNITKHASLLSRSISGVSERSKLLIISTVSAITSYNANLQPMHVLTPPAKVSLLYDVYHLSINQFFKDSQISINSEGGSFLPTKLTEPPFWIVHVSVFTEYFCVSKRKKRIGSDHQKN